MNYYPEYPKKSRRKREDDHQQEAPTKPDCPYCHNLRYVMRYDFRIEIAESTMQTIKDFDAWYMLPSVGVTCPQCCDGTKYEEYEKALHFTSKEFKEYNHLWNDSQELNKLKGKIIPKGSAIATIQNLIAKLTEKKELPKIQISCAEFLNGVDRNVPQAQKWGVDDVDF